MIDFSLLPVFLVAVLLLMITPGPDMVFVTANALGGGRRAGFASLLGVASGAYLHILAAAVGLSAVLLASETAYNVIRFAGAAYLCFLGVKFLMSGDAIISVNPARNKPLRAIYLQGVVTNLLNPKAALFTLSFVPQFVTPEIGPIWSQMLILGVVILAVMILVNLPIVFAAGRFAEWLSRRSGAGAALDKLIGLLLIGLAIYVAMARKPA